MPFCFLSVFLFSDIAICLILFNNAINSELSLFTSSNSLLNFSLLQIIFPFISIIINGNGEFINVVFAALLTFNVKSLNCSDNSDFFLLLFIIVAAIKIIYSTANIINAISSNFYLLLHVFIILRNTFPVNCFKGSRLFCMCQLNVGKFFIYRIIL